MKKTFKKAITITLALVLVLASLGVGIGAYFTDTDKKSDTYTIGQIEVEAIGADDLYQASALTPNEEWTFTRSVKNVGINDAYVFMAITVPTEEIYVHDLDGVHTKNDAALTQLFTYGTNGVTGIDNSWAPVTAGLFGDYSIEALEGAIDNRSGDYGAIRANNTITYVYAYVNGSGMLERLAADAETSALFDTMKFVNASDTVAQYNIENTVGKVTTQIFAIQADNVLETEYMTGNNTDGSEVVNSVWAVLNTSTNDKSLSTEDWGGVLGGSAITVTAKDQNGNDLNATARDITGSTAEDLLFSLEQADIVDADEVDALIEVKSDDFDNLADTTFDVSSIANEGDKVVILHFDENTQKWEYVGEETVDAEGKVNAEFSSYSPVAFVVITEKKSDVMMNGPEFNSVIRSLKEEHTIDTLTIADINTIPDGVETYDVSLAQDDGVVLWLDGTDAYVTARTSNSVVANDCTSMFEGMTEIKGIDLTGLDTSNNTSMEDMFIGCFALTDLNVSNLNTENVTNMSRTFFNCKAIETMDLSNFNTSNVTNMYGTFHDCHALQSLDLSDWNTENVTTMQEMFTACQSLETLDVSNFDTSKVTTMFGMFFNCYKLDGLNLSSFNTENVTDMYAMFANCTGLTELDLSNFNTAKVTNMSAMVANCSKLTVLDVSNFNISKVRDIRYMFQNCSSLTTIYGQDWLAMSDSIAYYTGGMFGGCTNLVGAIPYTQTKDILSAANPETGFFTDPSLKPVA